MKHRFITRHTAAFTTAVLGIILLGSISMTHAASSEQDLQTFYNEWRDYFPATIGTYKLHTGGSDALRLKESCASLDNNNQAKSYGISGTVCGKTLIGEYRQTSGNQVVFVHLIHMTEGKETYRTFLSHRGRGETLDGAAVLRIEKHELAWLPAATIDVIITQEGTWKAEENGGTSMSYEQPATGENPVIRRFLASFPSTNQNAVIGVTSSSTPSSISPAVEPQRNAPQEKLKETSKTKREALRETQKAKAEELRAKRKAQQEKLKAQRKAKMEELRAKRKARQEILKERRSLQKTNVTRPALPLSSSTPPPLPTE